MKRITIASIIIILIFNLIVSNNVNASYPSVIDGIIDKENLEQMEEAIDPGLSNSLAEEGATNIHQGSSNNDGTYSITDDKTFVKTSKSSGGAIAGIIAQVINLFPTTISAIMSYMVLSQEPDDSTIDEFTIQDLVYNNFRLFNINFFEIDNSSTDANNTIKRQVSKWYLVVRNLAIIISLCVLIYVGIRMAISTLAQDKAKYKQMLIDWLVGFILIFLMHYIIVFAMYTSEEILEIIPNQSENIETAIIDGNGTKKGLKEQMSETKGWNFATCCILYWVLVYYQVKFIILYLKRLLSVTILMVVSPLICAVYSIDKMKDKKAQSFIVWFKEMMVNIYIQPIHAIMYIVFVASASEIAKVAPLFAILFIIALSRGEKIVKNIFNIRGLSSINSLGTIKLK